MQRPNTNDISPDLGDEIAITIRGRLIAVTESLDRPTKYLIEYGRDKHKEWFTEAAITEGRGDE